GSDSVDIAHTDFIDLPSDWQNETLKSVELAVAMVVASQEAGEDVHSADFMEKAAAVIHAHWRIRHGHEEWVAGSPLEGDYKLMPEHEKEKDRVFVRCALA